MIFFENILEMCIGCALGCVFGFVLQCVLGGVLEKCPTKLTRIGVNDTFGESGPAKELIKKYKLDAEGIYKQIKEKL